MEITIHPGPKFVELRVIGNLDNQTSSYFRERVDDVIRNGSDCILVDLSQVSFLSSAGISALLASQKELQSIEGLFGVCAMSESVEVLLRHMKLHPMLAVDRETVAGQSVDGDLTLQTRTRIAGRDGVVLEEFILAPEARLQCRVTGSPAPLFETGFSEQNSHRRTFGKDRFGLGLGAFGDSFTDCSDRFGDFLAVSGSAAVSSSAGRGGADYLSASEDFVPSMQVLYGMEVEGQLSNLLRFQAVDGQSPLGFSNLVEVALSSIDSPAAGIVMVTECSGLVGATLRRSPVASTSAEDRFSFPDVRDWISFSTEQIHRHSLAVIAGVAVESEAIDDKLVAADFLRPLSTTHAIHAHFHAAAFPYRPLKKRTLDLNETISTLFESGGLQGVVHLLNDDRPMRGAGDTQLLNGACWVGPIDGFSAMEN